MSIALHCSRLALWLICFAMYAGLATAQNYPTKPIRVIVPFVMAIHPSVPARSVKQLIALAKARPGALNYSSSGIGSASQMATELFKYMTDTNMVHIPYAGKMRKNGVGVIFTIRESR